MSARGALIAFSVTTIGLLGLSIKLAYFAQEQSRRSESSQKQLADTLKSDRSMVDTYAKRQAELHGDQVRAWDRVTDLESELRACSEQTALLRAAPSASAPARRPPPKPTEVWVQ